jgi:ribosomal protein S18 acetylase RimI-like enzyme
VTRYDHPPGRSSEIIIRPIIREDNDAVRGLFMTAFLPYSENATPEQAAAVRGFIHESLADDLEDPYGHYMSQPGTCFFVADAGGRIAGMLGIDRWEGDGTVAQLRRVAVSHGFRRRGIAKMLMNHAEAWAAWQGYKSMRFYTAESLKEAIALYESLGYRLVRRHAWGPVCGREYEKLLAPAIM